MLELIDNFSPFFASVVACPISKEPLCMAGSNLVAPCGFVYRQGDLRVGLDYSKSWKDSQNDFERWQLKWLAAGERDPSYHLAVDQEVSDVYEAIKLSGNVLDVGGGFGLVAKQAALDTSTYISVDPLPIRWAALMGYKNFTTHYAACASLCRVPAFGEFLPIRTTTMDFVHLRSCIDHFANPLLALREAYRVLKSKGQVVIGISLEGAYKKDTRGAKGALKAFIKRNWITRELYELLFDHHIFHPTMARLTDMLENTGFGIDQVVWQKDYHNVVYVAAVKRG